MKSKDIEQELRLSAATVSIAINNRPGVKPIPAATDAAWISTDIHQRVAYEKT